MFNNPLYCDIKININGVTLHAHQFIVCARSKYFRKVVQDKPVWSSPGQPTLIEYNNKNGPAYWRAFEYIYNGTYSDQLSTKKLNDNPKLLKHYRVYCVAEELFMKNLKAIAKSKFEESLWALSVDQMEEFHDCVREVYAETCREDPGLRSIVVMAATRQNLNYSEELVREGGDFAVDFFQKISHKFCWDCGSPFFK
ncbi:hypothetical protein K3495_g8290 [Podosphaera aphanis]|nr:hypothetical protein K3495_g8290 [Podosphaera aphanis]